MADAHSQTKAPARQKRAHRTPGMVACHHLGTVAVVGVGYRSHGRPGHHQRGRGLAHVTGHQGRSCQPSGPVAVSSVTPADGTTQVPSDATVSVQFSVPLSGQSPTPSLSPAVAGVWQEVTPETFAFVPAAPLVPSTTETVTVPAGDAGVTSATGKKLAQPAVARFTVAAGKHPPPPAAAGPARLPAGRLHPGRTARRSPRRRPRPRRARSPGAGASRRRSRVCGRWEPPTGSPRAR